MSLIENAISVVKPHNAQDTIHVVDHSPLNWLYITYNTVEELVRIDEKGHIVPAATRTTAKLISRHTRRRLSLPNARRARSTGRAGDEVKDSETRNMRERKSKSRIHSRRPFELAII